jgi:diguanylate cyclase (GGDEF)-like protein
MHSSDSDKVACPVGEPQCEVIDALAETRRRNRELEELVHIDTLTGLYNYRHFSQALDREMERTRRTGQPTSLVMADLDHFKQLNDCWGHETGNRILRNTARLIRQMLRRIDVPCRYGGEEFAIILPGTQLGLAVTVANRLREAIREDPVELEGGEAIQFTISMGVDLFLPGQGDTVSSFVKRADQLLYQAKQEGRDRVCHSEYRYLSPESEVTVEEKRALYED